MSRPVALSTTLGRPLLVYASDDERDLGEHLRELFKQHFQQPEHEGWFHASPHDLPNGTVLSPGGADPASKSFYDQGFGQDRGTLQDMGGGRPEHVWLSPNRQDVGFWSAVNNAPHVYEVEPHEEPRPWNGTGTDGWVTPAATITRKVSGPKQAASDINGVNSWDRARARKKLREKKHLPPPLPQDDEGEEERCRQEEYGFWPQVAHREMTPQERAQHQQQGWRGGPCEDPSHHGALGGRCAECGRRVAPERVAAADPIRVYRGAGVIMTPELKKKIQQGLDWGDDFNPQFKHFSIGPALLDHMEKTQQGGMQDSPGLGHYWTTDRSYAERASKISQDINNLGFDEQGHHRQIPTVVSGMWDRSMPHAVRHIEEPGHEHVLAPGAPIKVDSVKIPMQEGYGRGDWMEVHSEPDNPDWGHLSNPPSIRHAARIAVELPWLGPPVPQSDHPVAFHPFEDGDELSHAVAANNGYDSQYHFPGVAAFKGDDMVGHLEWYGPKSRGNNPVNQVAMIKVHPDHKRQGIGSALFDWAKQNVNPDLHHSPLQTEEGRGWSKKTGEASFRVVPPGQSNPANYFTADELRERGQRYMREHPDWRNEPGLSDWARTLTALDWHSPGWGSPGWANPRSEPQEFTLKDHLPTDNAWMSPGYGEYPGPPKSQYDQTQSGKWYHTSPYKLEPGTRLVPKGAPSPGGEDWYGRTYVNRPNHVWLSPNVDRAHGWKDWAGHGSRVYEVKPGDRPQPWNFDGEAGWVAPHATVLHEVDEHGNKVHEDPVRAAMNLLAVIDDTPWLNAVYDEDLDEDDEEHPHGVIRRRV